MKKTAKFMLKIVPIILMGVILIISNFMFEANRIQTYERVKALKETQVQVIASQVDTIVNTTGKSFSSNPSNIAGLKKMIENVNEQAGVYCYLYDKDCNRISGFSKQQKHFTGEAIIGALESKNLEIESTFKYHGYVNIKISTGENFEVYWQGVPSGDRDECEYFIILTISEKEVQENEAIDICKAMIGILTIALGCSLYANIYVKPIIKNDEKENK